MPDPAPHDASCPASSDQARAALHALVNQLTDEAVRALRYLRLAWGTAAPRRRQQ